MLGVSRVKEIARDLLFRCEIYSYSTSAFKNGGNMDIPRPYL
jgi:hypothetical protein